MPVRNTNLYICYGIPWPRDYSHVRLFSNVGEQIAYIQSKAKFPVQGNLAYIRDDVGVGIRINIAADELKDCNYIAFQNLNYEGDWHYAFIDRVSYINDGLSIIYFTLDWFQTYCFNMEIQPGLVLREHVNDDTIGANTLQEPVMHGPIIADVEKEIGWEYEWYLYATEKVEFASLPSVEWFDPGELNHTGYYTARIGTLENAKAIVDRYTLVGKLEALVAFFARIPIPIGGFTSITAPAGDELDGYTPRNNKLLTYPYQYLTVVAPGQEKAYMYEYFAGSGNPSFGVYSQYDAATDLLVIPVQYMTATGVDPLASPDYATTVTGFPSEGVMANAFLNRMISRPLDSLLALGTAASFMGAGTTTYAGGSALVTAAQAGAGGSTGGTTFNPLTMSDLGGLLGANAMGDLWTDSLTPNNVVGTGSAANLFNYSKLHFKIKHMCVKQEYAKVIDQFFDVFGYRVCQVKAPNTTGRTSWNYVQMSNAIVTGNAPADAIQSYINRINSGITFWHTNDVGNYSLSNTIVGG